MEQRDPYNVLMNMGDSWDAVLLLGGPVLLILLFTVIFSFFVLARKRRDQKLLQEDYQDDQEAISVAERDSLQEEAQLADEALADDVVAIKTLTRTSWLQKLQLGLSKTSDNLKSQIKDLFQLKASLSRDSLEQLHEILYRADIGVKTADHLTEEVRKSLSTDQAADWQMVLNSLKQTASSIFDKSQTPDSTASTTPRVILIVGVNGVGKTTSVGKLAAHFLAQSKKPLLCAADTFRAAAIEQLCIWGDRLGVEVIRHKAGADPAAVAFDGVKAAKARGVDTLLIDTAGRLHNKKELMEELQKIKRSITKEIPEAPHEVWLVIDATTGQNANLQVKAFREVVDVTGLIVTKLDGTAKGGVIIGICDEHKLPVRYIGVGEKASDLREFIPEDYVNSIFT